MGCKSRVVKISDKNREIACFISTRHKSRRAYSVKAAYFDLSLTLGAAVSGP